MLEKLSTDYLVRTWQ